MVVAAIDSSSWEVISPVVSCDPTILTLTRTSEPLSKTVFCGISIDVSFLIEQI